MTLLWCGSSPRLPQRPMRSIALFPSPERPVDPPRHCHAQAMPHCRSRLAEVKGQAREGLTMRYLIALAAVVLLGLAPYGSLCAQSAMAPYPGYGYYGGSGYELSPREIAASVRAKGLQPLSRPQRKGQAYVLRALDAADRELQVTDRKS